MPPPRRRRLAIPESADQPATAFALIDTIMRISTILKMIFEALIAAACFAVSWSAYQSALKSNESRPDTNAMIAIAFIGGSIALLMLVQSVLKLRQDMRC